MKYRVTMSGKKYDWIIVDGDRPCDAIETAVGEFIKAHGPDFEEIECEDYESVVEDSADEGHATDAARIKQPGCSKAHTQLLSKDRCD